MLRAACLILALAAGANLVSAVQSDAQDNQAGSANALDTGAAQSVFLAEESPELHAMLDAMGMYEIIAIMGTETSLGAADMEAQLFPGAGGAAWQAMVSRLHANDRMVALFETAFDRDALSPEQVAEVMDFLQSDTGQRIIAGEIAARRLFLDDAAVDAATETFMAAIEAGDRRLEILQRFNTVNALIERNVSSALNLRFAFYQGLMAGDAFADPMPEDTMLADVWGQEPEVRRITIEWLFSFQLAAYADISDAELEAYIDISQTQAGRALNAEIFAAFDVMLTELSRELGSAAAVFIAGEDT